MASEMNSKTLTVIDGRRSANYHPNIWDGDRIRSLKSHYNDSQSNRHEELKQAVQRTLDVTLEPLDRLILIDDIKRLGVAYQFEKQINDALDDLYSHNAELVNKNDLHAASLYFRLIRQHGCYISSDIFTKFKEGEGGFKASLCEDVDGLLSLYEASFLGIKGETILDEAKAFSTSNLKKLMDHVKARDAERIAHALDLPLHWRVIRVEARHYIDVYKEKENGRNDDLLEFAKLDYNMVQSLHQEELKELSIWWDSMDLARKLGFFRDRLMESFLLSVGLLDEPKYSEWRKAITKAINMITVIDDIYDVYGSLDELELFTDAVNGWDLRLIDQLPEYMKLAYMVLINTANEMTYITLKETGWNAVDFVKEKWVTLCNNYIIEARWFHKGHIPTMEEYLKISTITAGATITMAQAYTFTEPPKSKDELVQIDHTLKLLSLSSLIFRLCDDLGTSKAEQLRGDVPKSVECYMHETGVSEEVAQEHIKDLMSNAWKELNEESFKDAPFGRTFANVIIYGARLGVCTYRHGDGYGNYATNDQVMSLFVEAVPTERRIKCHVNLV
ncbi:sesquiterpene synthase TPS3-like [Magnolia sinica]|uniref:sesquiterpene synthase TPS3-like n=1 Tax=Magnolia sinica TaxID=86752 RepID=UPI00265AC252|nr:sesquiterpene synthase TPS3-like [Magnolia sinica]